ncbi:ImmA/IrrE family metallo-endopeptidase [Labrys okinawensis]|uniref:ImmA/IrrE family metallo-endopeptidase n=1 Tax=Labrys okinawensis TaxID=346911 RepID=UPI0039BC6EB5
MSNLRRGFKTWCENAAASYRRDLALGRDAALDPLILARHLRIVVWTPEQVPGIKGDVVTHLTVTDADSWDAVTIQSHGVTAIVLNSAPDIGRRNNSLAHELSHIILEHEPAHVFHTPDGHMLMNEYNAVHEEEANCLAGTLLVPREALLQAIRLGLNDSRMASHFGVSPQLLRMRRNVTGVDRQLSYSRG